MGKKLFLGRQIAVTSGPVRRLVINRLFCRGGDMFTRTASLQYGADISQFNKARIVNSPSSVIDPQEGLR